MKRQKRQKRLWTAAAVCAVLGTACLGIPGVRFSGLLFWCAAALLIVFAVLDRMDKPWARRAQRALLALICIGALAFAWFEALVVSGAHTNPAAENAQCIVILGAGVNGTEPSLMLSSRLQAALDFIADKPDIPIICSGGQGPGEDISEADCMAGWLIAHGVDEKRIYREDRSTSTRENFDFSYAIMAENGLDTTGTFAYVTNDYHIYRAGRIAGVPLACGVAATLPRTAYYDGLQLNYYVREAFALGWLLLNGG